MLEKILAYDTELFLYLNNLGTESWDWLWLGITNKWIFGPCLGVLLLFLFQRKFGWKAVLILIVTAALMITFTDQITNVFKRGFARPRPCGEQDLIDQMRFIAVRCGKYGFFSGHSSNSMAIAIFGGLLLKNYYKRLIYVLIVVSLIIAYSRIYLGVHYPADIVCGLTFGVFSGYIFYKLGKYAMQKFIAS
ncbi:phosphatase PAP2 family protein [Seonamhaeicola sp. ML3]|uniref:phosphatase PAP2 family protein n=1 Tax=Seonamhaeicola sp. ML3 TaxID=2937786 RepID=UPI00200DC992|nr:phosphatase PAP2 family protein [Seonamhaeicola sp. ML3]